MADGWTHQCLNPSTFEMFFFFGGGVGVLRWKCWVLGEWLGD